MRGARSKLPGQSRLDAIPPPGCGPAQFEACLGPPGEPADSGRFRENHVGSIFWVETLLAAVSAGLAVVTGLCPDWIERALRMDPDLHSGSIEWNIVIACAVSTAFFADLARRQWRKSLAA